MSGGDIQHEAIGRVYAEAMFALAEQADQSDALLEELTGLAEYLRKDAAAAAALTDPQGDVDVRSRLLEKSFRGRASDTLVDALQVINAKGRMEFLPAIVEGYRRVYESARKIAEVFVTSAIPLTDELRAGLSQSASRYAGREVRLIESVDASLLGGLIVRVGDVKLDTSLSRHLSRLHTAMHEQGERSIHGESEKRFVESPFV